MRCIFRYKARQIFTGYGRSAVGITICRFLRGCPTG
jgi:hypothetical protein